MPGVLRQFYRQYPRVQLEISDGLQEEASKLWALGKIDLDFASTSETIAINATQGHRPTPASVAFTDCVISEAEHLMKIAHT